MKVDAIVLAGGDGAVIDPMVSIKGLVPVAGRAMVEWVVEALKAAQTVDRVAVVVPTDQGLGDLTSLVDTVVVSDAPFIDNVMAGVDAFAGDRFVLVTTGDLPALTPQAVDDYVTASLEAGVEVSYPLVSKQSMIDQFPGSERTFIRLRDGEITGGNMMLLSPDILAKNRDIGQRLFETRKSPVSMARVIGIPFIFKLITGRLEVSDVERKMEQLLGGRCGAIRTDHASIGADVDKPIDVVVAERVLYEQGRSRIYLVPDQ